MAANEDDGVYRSWESAEPARGAVIEERRKEAAKGHIFLIVLVSVYLGTAVWDLICGSLLQSAVKITVSVLALKGKSAARWIFCGGSIFHAMVCVILFFARLEIGSPFRWLYVIAAVYFTASGIFSVKSRAIDVFYEMRNSNRF